MRAIEIAEFGPPDGLRLTQRPEPACGPTEVLLKVGAAGINRPDATQRRGLYPPPPGVTDIPGLDVAGQVIAVGDKVQGVKPGDFLCGLVAGGGYAEYVAIPQEQCLPIPSGLNLVEAASLPEVFFTAWNKVMEVGRLAQGETILIQGGTSGVGMAAVQIAKAFRQARVIATAGSREKLDYCLRLGVDLALDYKDRAWDKAAYEFTGERGVDVIIDAQAGENVQRQLNILAVGGRLVLMATHENVESTVNFRTVVRRRLTIAGSVIRSRTPAEKGLLAAALKAHVWPLLSSGRIKTHIQRTFTMDEIVDAHWMLERNEQLGKLVMIVDDNMVRSYAAGT